MDKLPGRRKAAAALASAPAAAPLIYAVAGSEGYQAASNVDFASFCALKAWRGRGRAGQGATRGAHCLCKCFFNNCMPQLADPPEINVTHVCVGKRASKYVCVLVCVCANVR